MKFAPIIFIFIFIWAASTPVQAQLNRDIGKSYDTPKKKKKENVDFVELSVQLLVERLTLDNFQEAVVKDILKSSQVEQEKVLQLDIPNESKNEQLLVVREQVNLKIVEILTPIQVEKFDEMKKQSKKKK